MVITISDREDEIGSLAKSIEYMRKNLLRETKVNNGCFKTFHTN